MRSTLPTIVALASSLQLASAVGQITPLMRDATNEKHRVGPMPLHSLARPTQTINATVNNPLGLTGVLSTMVLSPPMATFHSKGSHVPALSVAAQSVIS
jgi:hypothetical protein